MSNAAAQARHIALARYERAAGEAFGFAEEARVAARAAFVTPAALALATFATALAATITYLV
ncbi:hypothetical protein J2X36_001942 [Methylobacterium sp. BE186]|uniref:hypothetical protein n=1 Tax=Methylobacterium sp. BE186 TaxID=2817715 RepID=UPI0028637AEA|nr:hypothetical protein [Methylobacterium sp. BE186]MDR7037195.1 hypothetical protein [Methylobacterium sp. BE186]